MLLLYFSDTRVSRSSVPPVFRSADHYYLFNIIFHSRVRTGSSPYNKSKLKFGFVPRAARAGSVNLERFN